MAPTIHELLSLAKVATLPGSRSSSTGNENGRPD